MKRVLLFVCLAILSAQHPSRAAEPIEKENDILPLHDDASKGMGNQDNKNTIVNNDQTDNLKAETTIEANNVIVGKDGTKPFNAKKFVPSRSPTLPNVDSIENVKAKTKTDRTKTPTNNVVDTKASIEKVNDTTKDNVEKIITPNILLETSKNITGKLKNVISGLATTNITYDAWKNQTWANKTPLEVVTILETEMNHMIHDKYVHFVAITLCIVSLCFTLYTVQQIIEHPNGLLSKLCRCTIGCLRILCCPMYTIFCCSSYCCCCFQHNKKNRPNSNDYLHLPTHEVEVSKKN
jgi:hypothetical protein